MPEALGLRLSPERASFSPPSHRSPVNYTNEQGGANEAELTHVFAAQEDGRGESCGSGCAGLGVWPPDLQASTHLKEQLDCPLPKGPFLTHRHILPGLKGENEAPAMGIELEPLNWLPDLGSLHLLAGLGRSPGEENHNTPQYSCLENTMDRGTWQATVCGVAKSWT